MNTFARADFAVFRRLMHFDFGPIEQDLNIDCFSTVCHYQAIPKRERMYNRDISQQVRALRAALAEAADENAMFDLVTDYYRRYGYGVFAMSRAFRIRHEDNGTVTFLPISNIDGVMLDDLLGYEKQKQELRRNTGDVPGRQAGQQRPALRRRRYRQVHQRQGPHQRVL